MNEQVQTTISIWQLLLPVLAGPAASIVVGVIAKAKASSNLKAVLNLLISAISGALLTLPSSVGSFDWPLFVVGGFITWVTSIAVHFGFWKPQGTAEAVRNATSNFGIG